MREGRDCCWGPHVEAWRPSGQSKKAYSEQHELPYWSMRYWASKLSEQEESDSQQMVELGPAGEGAKHGRDQAPIEVVVGDRYVVRLWPHLRATQLREVLAILDSSR